MKSAPLKLSILLVVAALGAVAGCAAEPTDPSKLELSGVWKSFDQDFHIRNIVLTLDQPSPGIIVGKWRADGRTDDACVVGVPCADSSIVTGRNEIAQVVLELLGAGTFVGERVKADTLKGIIRTENKNFHVTFGKYP